MYIIFKVPLKKANLVSRTRITLGSNAMVNSTEIHITPQVSIAKSCLKFITPRGQNELKFMAHSHITRSLGARLKAFGLN